MSAMFAGIGAKIFGGLLVVSLVAGAYFLWESRVRRGAILEAQNKALVELQRRQAETVAHKNRIWQVMLSLPEGRARACAVKGAGDPCCESRGECAP